MAKAVILKPIVWNDNNYKKPSGSLKNYKRFTGDKKYFFEKESKMNRSKAVKCNNIQE